MFSSIFTISDTFVALLRFFHVTGRELLVFLRSKRCLTPSNSKKNKKHNDPTNIMPTWNIFWKYFSSIFCQKSLKLTFFQHFHYFGHFCCSSSFFQGNWPWTARLPAFKSLSNSGQVEKLREIRTEKIFCTKIFFAKNIFPQFIINEHKTWGFHHFHFFVPFHASFYIFPYNWPWATHLPAFKIRRKNAYFTDQQICLILILLPTLVIRLTDFSDRLHFIHHFIT